MAADLLGRILLFDGMEDTAFVIGTSAVHYLSNLPMTGSLGLSYLHAIPGINVLVFFLQLNSLDLARLDFRITVKIENLVAKISIESYDKEIGDGNKCVIKQRLHTYQNFRLAC